MSEGPIPAALAAEFEAIAARYPKRAAAMLPVLTRLQEARGFLSEESVRQVAALLGVSEAHVHGVVSFYSMYDRSPVGRHKLYVCRTLSCRLRGAEDVLRAMEEKLGVKRGETTGDGRFTIVPFECLGLCEQAPAVLCGGKRWGNLTPETAAKILEELP